jgi:hypothetical protein
MRQILMVCLLVGLPLLDASAGQQKDKDPAKAIRAKLFREKFLASFCLGVDAPLEWLKETREKNGCRWDCKVGYLSGSVGPGMPKPYWLNFGNSPEKIVGEVRKLNITPWLTFYALSGSAPGLNKLGPAQSTPINAKVASTMKEYFGLFKILMQGCGKETSGPILVHIEPDEWCHLYIAGGNDPTKVDIKVGSSGMDELKGLPDNLIGFGAAFKKLRDLYAPNNVLLGCNPSAWDSAGSQTGLKMGQLMKVVAGDWDFAVFETGDRDKGMDGKPAQYGNSITITGNLENHLRWISEFHAASGLYVFVWQVAIGNTYFATCNNTPGHYCDNLAQMLLEDYPKNPTISRYVKAGCVGWMFMGGQGDADTHVHDNKKDGITNPTAISGNQGHIAEYPDDDGGYLRLRAGNYYKKPYSIQSKQLGKSTPPDMPDTNPPK